MKLNSTCLLAGLLLSVVALELRADYLIYRIPLEQAGRGGGRGNARGGPRGYVPSDLQGAQSDEDGNPIARGPQPPVAAAAPSAELKLVLTGRMQLSGRTVTYSHPSLKDPIIFGLEDVEYKKAATPQQEFGKRLGTAGKDPGSLMQTAIWAAKKGLVKEFHSAIDKVLEVDPRHATAIRIRELRKHIEQPLPDNPEIERELRNDVKSPGMQVATSNHFILLHNVSTKPAQGQRKSRAQERLDLLEKVYESFLLAFAAQDADFEVPRDRLKVVLLNDQKDFEEFAERLKPSLRSDSSFWDTAHNVSAFHDHATNKTIQSLEKLQADMQQSPEAPQGQPARRGGGYPARGNPQAMRVMRVLEFLVELARDNADISAVSHAAAHQMAATTGLLPRHVEIPRWVHEGLATYFETPADGTTSGIGIGAVTDGRLELYRALEKDSLHSSIEFVAGDQVVDYARSEGVEQQGFGQAWALTHFLLENHPKEFVAYFRALGQMPPDVPLNPGLLTELFGRTFGSQRSALHQEWRQYMRSLKTDLELLDDSSSPVGRGRS